MADDVELYKALVAKPGVWAADGGELTLAPADIDHMERTFRQLQGEGFTFSTPWGHKLDALPESAAADPYAYDEARVRWNAGYIAGVERRGDELWAVATVPPGYRVDRARRALVNDKDGTVVRETSPGIGTWTDGLGRTHRNVLFHLALVTHPVQHGQTGIEPAGTAARPAGLRLLSASGRVTGLRYLGAKMPGDNDKKKPEQKDNPFTPGDKPKGADAVPNDKADDKPKGGGSPDPTGGDAGLEGLLEGMGAGEAPPGEPTPESTVMGPDTPAPGALPPSPDVPPIGPDPAADAAANPAGIGGALTPTMMEQFKQVLAQLGAPMLPDTSAQNFHERLLTALHTLANTGASLQPQGQGGAGQPLDLGMGGAQPDPNQAGMGAGGMGAPMFMSTRTRKPLPLEGAAKVLAGKAADAERAEIEAEWDKIARAGDATVKAQVAKEKQLLGRFHLSLNPDTGEVRNQAARARLADARFWVTRGGLFKLQKQLATARVETGNAAAAAPRPKPSPAPGQATGGDLAAEVGRLLNVPADKVRIERTQPAA